MFRELIAKTTLSALATTLLASSAFALEGTLTNLDCVASNGVNITTAKTTAEGVFVTTSWGLFRKTFEAKLGLVGHGSDSYVTLEDANSKPAYLISLSIDPSLSEPQTATGSLLRQSIIPGGAPAFIAAIRCTIDLN